MRAQDVTKTLDLRVRTETWAQALGLVVNSQDGEFYVTADVVLTTLLNKQPHPRVELKFFRCQQDPM